MGWSYCGKDSLGRDIGYQIEATCDHPKCNKKIDRGLSYACGGVHGSDWYCCEGYFCSKHLFYSDNTDIRFAVCKKCLKKLRRSE